MKLQKDLELCVLRIQTLSSMMRREGRKESELDSPRLAKQEQIVLERSARLKLDPGRGD